MWLINALKFDGYDRKQWLNDTNYFNITLKQQKIRQDIQIMEQRKKRINTKITNIQGRNIGTLSSLSSEEVSSIIPKTVFSPVVITVIKKYKSNIRRAKWRLTEKGGDEPAFFSGTSCGEKKSHCCGQYIIKVNYCCMSTLWM